MRQNIPTTDELIALAQPLSFATQHILREREDIVAKTLRVSEILADTPDVRHYLLLTSLPFSFGHIPQDFSLTDLWPTTCTQCPTVVFRHTMPTGNIRPRIIVIGDAPGVGDGALENAFDRKWVYGPSSRLLRLALSTINRYTESWFSNLLRCSTPNNRPSLVSEVTSCSPYLVNEIATLKPEIALVLGAHAKELLPRLEIPVAYAQHPAYWARRNASAKDYGKHLALALEKVGK